MAKKIRADQLLVQQGIFENIEEAALNIRAGLIRIGSDHLVRKPNELYTAEQLFEVHQHAAYVSRGAFKLKPALDKYLPDLKNKTALDLGASTGGFTDLILQRNAVKVYAVDVGYGLLHYKLRQDKRVVCLEKTNARYLNKEIIPEGIDLLTVDLSFISVKKVLPAAKKLLKAGAWVFILIKPQFEVSKKDVGNGVITDPDLRNKAVEDICSFAVEKLQWQLAEVIPSPIKGPKGNQEYVAVMN